MNENFAVSTISVCVTAAFIALCVAGKGCNDSDNAMKARVIERGCSYLGDSKIICGWKSQPDNQETK